MEAAPHAKCGSQMSVGSTTMMWMFIGRKAKPSSAHNCWLQLQHTTYLNGASPQHGFQNVTHLPRLREEKSMVMKKMVMFGAKFGWTFWPFCLETHIFMCGALKLSGIVRANFRLNIAIAMLFVSLKDILPKGPCRTKDASGWRLTTP